MKYILNGNWINDSTITELPTGASLLTDEEWENRTGDNTPMSVEEARDLVWERIKAKREYIEFGGAKVVIDSEDKWFHTSTGSRLQHIGLTMMGESMPPGIQWKTWDNTYVTMTPTIALQVFNAIAALDLAAFQVAQLHKANVDASPDPLNYDYTTGWPTIFEDTIS